MRTVDDFPAPPARPDDAHKGTFGTVIVVGGSTTMPGAPAICARAALRAGVGLVKIAASADVLPVALGITPSATGIVLATDPAGIDAELNDTDSQYDAVFAIGPGLGTDNRITPVVAHLLQRPNPIVLDADGLNHLAAHGKPAERHDATGPLIMTPHPGEFRRLAAALDIDADPTDPARRAEAARQLAIAHRAVVVLKGHHTVVVDADGSRVYINRTGNPALATAGSGDVLTGLIAGLIAQGIRQHDDAFGFTCLAVHAHGLAADDWARAHGNAGLLATELADRLPDALNRLRQRNVAF